MDKNEALVIGALVDLALASGYTVSVHDGEDWAITRRADKAAIMAALGATDEETMILRDANGIKVAALTLIYGNEPWEVIADYSAPDLDAFASWLRPVDRIGEEIEANYV